MNKKIVSLGLGAGLAAGSFAGLVAVPAISGAQTASTNSNAAASAPADQGRPDPSARFAETLKPLVDNGTITQSQSDAVIAALVADGPHGDMKGGRGGPGMDVAAQALGMSADELHTALDGGQTLAQIAESKGVSVQVLTDALAAAERTHLAQEVADGRLTQDRADQMLANVDQHVADIINGVRPQAGPKDGHGPRGQQGQAPSSSSGTTTN